MFKSFNEFLDWAAGKILTDFIMEGGKGLRSGIIAVVDTFETWQDELKKKEKGKH